MARGAVVLIISDGWDTGDPELVGRQMARLSRMPWMPWMTCSPRSGELSPGTPYVPMRFCCD
jgi:hypothetical protein